MSLVQAYLIESVYKDNHKFIRINRPSVLSSLSRLLLNKLRQRGAGGLLNSSFGLTHTFFLLNNAGLIYQNPDFAEDYEKLLRDVSKELWKIKFTVLKRRVMRFIKKWI